MPDVVMNIILKKVGVQSVQVLRKVCRDLRNFIEEHKPESYIDQATLSIDLDSVHLGFPFNSIVVKYKKHEKGCRVICPKTYNTTEKILDNSDFLETALNDFKVIMKNQKNGVGFFNICFKLFSLDDIGDQELIATGFREKLEKSLQSWDHPVPVRRVIIGTVNQTEVMSILRYLDPKLLEDFEMSASRYVDSIPMEFDKILGTDHWKNLKTLKMSVFRKSLSGDELTELRNAFQGSTSLKSMEVTYQFLDKSGICNQLGQPTVTQDFLGTRIETWEVGVSPNTLRFTLVPKEKSYAFIIRKIPIQKTMPTRR
ncbi:hypothetical protein CRE_05078 [Caenorhabditis remanei]|uniref:Uncharacterized protein n=1 Tax=Caenorhabditis remanei TaxID=31234 RepID=E3MZ26_CAERE|nr:hypothetical protein CRE_05078 [Caenorhabditis remanei]